MTRMSRHGISTRVGFTLAPEAIELPPDFDAKQSSKQLEHSFMRFLFSFILLLSLP